ncbi:hypothetical protein HS088_TW19G00667 [Tripterygium wilfordii]|uniref:Uncharacterized protein n=1 Tax=Tripterygium wilfordii TaxID=458696 RepID=A0A7J7CAB1_TRIWF|nr:uncharacterized protein LOC119985226 [Tripterygium wilfordii]KAF5731063.1 hypothetical protein HS088_TW19G00667 [Tripterygium wilfordii]
MGRGVTCDEAAAGGGGGDGSLYTEVSSSTVVFEDMSDFRKSSKSYRDHDVGDVFFGTDDIADTRDLLYKEDVLESYRRDEALKSSKKRQKKRCSLIAQCFQFLNLMFCIR